MQEQLQRAAVIAEARTWFATPYHHAARVKGAGADCATLPAEVYAAAGVIPPVAIGHYPPDWHLHRESERYLAIISTLAGPIEREAARPGDVVLFRFGRAFSHGAIITEWPQVVHANRRDGAVVYGDLERDTDLTGRPQVFFSYWARVNVG